MDTLEQFYIVDDKDEYNDTTTNFKLKIEYVKALVVKFIL